MYSPKRKVQVTARSADFVLRVTAGGGVCLQGQIEHVQSGHVQQFRSCLELIHLIQAKLDESGFPQPAMAMRTWSGETFPPPIEGGQMR